MTNIKLRDGDVTLYHRTDSKNWQAEIRLPDGGRQTASLRTANEQIAKERAIKMFEDIYARHRYGLTAKVVSLVISPFLTGCIRRTYAAIFSFMAGVMPPMPMLGRSLL